MSKGKVHTKIIDVNIIIKNTHVLPNDTIMVFGDDPILWLPEGSGLVDILVVAEISQSKRQAKQNGHLQWIGDDGHLTDKEPAVTSEVPSGFSEFLSGKLKHKVAIWNPSE